MFRNTTATPSAFHPIKHAATTSDVSFPEKSAVGQPLITKSKINGLSATVRQEIEEIAKISIENKEKIDDLMHSIDLTELKIQALEGKAQFEEKERGNQSENSLKQDLEEAIGSFAIKEKSIRKSISNISEEIQNLEKKQQQKIKVAATKEADFKRLLINYEAAQKEKNDLEEKESDLNEKSLALQNDKDAKTSTIESLSRQVTEIEASIKEVLDGEVEKTYEGMMQEIENLLLEKHGFQFPSEKKIEKLTKYLCDMTDQLMSTSEQKKRVEEKYKKIDNVSYIAYGVFLCSMPIIYRAIMSQYRSIGQENSGNVHEVNRMRKQHESDMAWLLKEPYTEVLITTMACICGIFFSIYQNKLRKKEIDKIGSAEKPVHRMLKKGIYLKDPTGGELLMFALWLEKHANIKLIKSLMKAMQEEVAVLVMDAKGNMASKINETDRIKRKTKTFSNLIKAALEKETQDLSKKLDEKIDKFNARKTRKEEKYDKRQFDADGLLKKAKFVKRIAGDNQANAGDGIVDKAIFIDELTKIFNSFTEDELADAVKNIVIAISQTMKNKLSAVSEVELNELPESSFERSIKEADQERHALKMTMDKTCAESERINQEKEEIKNTIASIEKDIKTKEFSMNDYVKAMEKTPLGESQLRAYETRLRNARIQLNHQGEYPGFTLKKIRNIKTQQQKNNERLTALIDTHDELYKEYSDLKEEKKKIENQLEKIKFLEKSRADKDTQIKELRDEIKERKEKIARLESEEAELIRSLESKEQLKEILTEKAIRLVKLRHMAQSDSALQMHAIKTGYSSNYRSAGHFLRACLDTHQALQRKIEESESDVPMSELNGYFVDSGIDVADGMNRRFQSMPISASVSDIVEIRTSRGERKYLIDHIYGYVPRRAYQGAVQG